MAVFPSSHRHWACPVHLTAENLNGILSTSNIGKALEGARMNIRLDDWSHSASAHLPVLPECSVRLQFGWSSGAISYQRTVGCTVPEEIRSSYQRMRQLSLRQIRLGAYYEHYSYVDREVETNIVI
jgi:hypothetical protein